MKRLMFVGCALAACAAFAQVPYQLGIAGYSFCRYKGEKFDRALEIMQAIDCHYLCIKDFHLKLDATDAEIAAFREKCAKYGVECKAIGPLYFREEKPARQLFEQAKKMGIKTVVVVPYGLDQGLKDEWSAPRYESEEMLDVLEKLVKEFDIRAAIHNHGPDIPKLYPTAEAAMARIAKRDRRIGVCLDIGHERRAGFDPVAFIRRHGDRIYDVHVKNIKIDPVKNLAMQGPRGELDLPAILSALAAENYTGVCHLEYEGDFDDNAMGLADTIGYLRGVMDSVVVKAKMMPPPEGANTLSAAEKATGWKLLWDGRTSAGWVGVKGGCKQFPDHGWVMEGGTLTMRPVNGISPAGQWFPLPPEDQKLGGGGDIVTEKKYRDFEFAFDFRLTRAANSGIKYYYDETVNGGTCEEYQILENGHPDSDKGVDGNRKAASLYDIYPAKADGVLKGIGQWNSGRIVAKGAHVEHWLNGVKVLEYERGSKAFRDAVAKSKYATWGKTADGQPQPWGEVAEGRLLLQDHSDSTVSYCNLKVREL